MDAVYTIEFLSLVIGCFLVGRIYEQSRWRRKQQEREEILAELQLGPRKLTSADRVVGLSAPQDVQGALEAMAVEIERIGEGQRFLTKLLSKREPQSSSSMASPIPGVSRSPIPPLA